VTRCYKLPALGAITTHALLTSYGPALVFLAIGLIVAAAFGMAPRLLGPRRAAASRQSQLTPYECGLPSEVTRNFRFGISFYLIAMLFILFDIEVVFLYPIAVQLRAFGTFALVETSVFIALLMVGFAYVWRRGALEWK
jgi:NADH-quinone oxidoreductase subunit A